MRLASAGEAPAVEIAMASGPVRTIAGRMKLQSGGTSTMFEHRALLGVLEHLDVHVGVVGRGDRDESGLEVALLVLALDPLDRALARQVAQRLDRVRRDQ